MMGMPVVKERVQKYRDRMRARGFRQVQLWVPDPRTEAFRAEAARECALVAEADRRGDDMDVVEAISLDWDEN